MLMKLKVIGNKKQILLEPYIKHFNQPKRCKMNKCWKNKSKLEKQWKNQKRTLKNMDHQKMRKLFKRKRRKNNKNFMLKK